MTTDVKQDLAPILEAIREVEESLDCRANRLGGALMVMWGAIAGAISLFYQLVAWNPAPYDAALGPFLPWAWLVPIGVGYVAALFAGVSIARESPSPETRRAAVRDVVPAVVTGVIAAVLSFLALWAYLPGALLLGYAATLALRVRLANVGMRRLAWASAAACALAGAALLALQPTWGFLASGALMAGTLVALGRYRMARARTG